MEEKQYIVPPDLGQKYMIGGLTVPELFISVLFFFIALAGTLHGAWQLLLLPTTTVLLCVRMEGAPNALTLLKIRFGYITSVQQYSLNPWKGRA